MHLEEIMVEEGSAESLRTAASVSSNQNNNRGNNRGPDKGDGGTKLRWLNRFASKYNEYTEFRRFKAEHLHNHTWKYSKGPHLARFITVENMGSFATFTL